MGNELDMKNACDEIMQLLDDGRMSDEERSQVRQILDQPTEAIDDKETAIVDELRKALVANPFEAEADHNESTLVQSIVARLKEQLHVETMENGVDVTIDPISKDQKSKALDASLMDQKIGGYQVLRLLGRGGMGAVYEANDPLLHRHVALKVVLPSLATNEQLRARFLREARAAARVEHDNICPIYQVGEENGIAFIAMPQLVGESLESRLRKERMPLQQTLDIALQIAKGLEAAHQSGLIHRDIKPANIWLETRKDGAERVRLLDFGLAQIESEEVNLTQPGAILGTPAYMSPEQARGKTIDGRTDLFSVGAILYELIARRKAFQGKNPTSVLSSILTEQPEAPASLDPSCSASLSDLVMNLLQKDPDNRISSASELISRIDSLLAAERTRQTSDGTTVDRSRKSNRSYETETQHAIPESSSRFGSRGIWTWVLAAGIGGLLFALTIIFQTSSGTLVVETTEDAETRFKNGELQILDGAGKIQYRLTSEAPTQKLHPGTYHVKVVGADGLQLSTETFAIERDSKTVIRVTAKPNESEPSVTDSGHDLATGSTPKNRASMFKGKSLIACDFSTDDATPVPLVDKVSARSFIKDGRFTYERRTIDPADPFITIPVGARLSRGAMVARFRAKNCKPFINFSTRNDGKQSRWLSIVFENGNWQLYIARQDLKDGKWEQAQPTLLATSDISENKLLEGNWINLACRWSEKDYDVWVNDKQIAGGSLPSQELTIGNPMVSQICSRALGLELPTLEIAHLYFWDQTDISREEAKRFSPIGM